VGRQGATRASTRPSRAVVRAVEGIGRRRHAGRRGEALASLADGPGDEPDPAKGENHAGTAAPRRAFGRPPAPLIPFSGPVAAGRIHFPLRRSPVVADDRRSVIAIIFALLFAFAHSGIAGPRPPSSADDPRPAPCRRASASPSMRTRTSPQRRLPPMTLDAGRRPVVVTSQGLDSSGLSGLPRERTRRTKSKVIRADRDGAGMGMCFGRRRPVFFCGDGWFSPPYRGRQGNKGTPGAEGRTGSIPVGLHRARAATPCAKGPDGWWYVHPRRPTMSENRRPATVNAGPARPVKKPEAGARSCGCLRTAKRGEVIGPTAFRNPPTTSTSTPYGAIFTYDSDVEAGLQTCRGTRPDAAVPTSPTGGPPRPGRLGGWLRSWGEARLLSRYGRYPLSNRAAARRPAWPAYRHDPVPGSTTRRRRLSLANWTFGKVYFLAPLTPEGATYTTKPEGLRGGDRRQRLPTRRTIVVAPDGSAVHHSIGGPQERAGAVYHVEIRRATAKTPVQRLPEPQDGPSIRCCRRGQPRGLRGRGGAGWDSRSPRKLGHSRFLDGRR